MKTCRNCYWRKLVEQPQNACWVCLENERQKYSCWRPRPWVPVLIFALVGLALIIAMCIVIAVLDQERINAIPRPEPVASSFVFVRPACGRIAVSAENWYVYERWRPYVTTWTIYSVIGPDDGCAISKGK